MPDYKDTAIGTNAWAREYAFDAKTNTVQFETVMNQDLSFDTDRKDCMSYHSSKLWSSDYSWFNWQKVLATGDTKRHEAYSTFSQGFTPSLQCPAWLVAVNAQWGTVHGVTEIHTKEVGPEKTFRAVLTPKISFAGFTGAYGFDWRVSPGNCTPPTGAYSLSSDDKLVYTETTEIAIDPKSGEWVIEAVPRANPSHATANQIRVSMVDPSLSFVEPPIAVAPSAQIEIFTRVVGMLPDSAGIDWDKNGLVPSWAGSSFDVVDVPNKTITRKWLLTAPAVEGDYTLMGWVIRYQQWVRASLVIKVRKP